MKILLQRSGRSRQLTPEAPETSDAPFSVRSMTRAIGSHYRQLRKALVPLPVTFRSNFSAAWRELNKPLIGGNSNRRGSPIAGKIVFRNADGLAILNLNETLTGSGLVAANPRPAIG